MGGVGARAADSMADRACLLLEKMNTDFDGSLLDELILESA